MATLTRALGLVIPGIPPSGNWWLRVGHWGRRHHETQRWQTLVGWVVQAARADGHWDGQAFDPAHVTVRYRFPDRRRRDPDNYLAAAKSLVDGLVAAGVLVDDSFAHLTLTVAQGPVHRTGLVELWIEAVGPDGR